MGNVKEAKQLDKKSKLKLRAGIVCLSMFLLLILIMLLTSTNGILISLAIAFHISGMFLIATSGLTKGRSYHHYNSQTYSLKEYLKPTNQFGDFFSRHRK